MMPEEVDVTDLITGGNYLPDSCNGQLIRLIRAKSPSYRLDTTTLKGMIVQWAIDEHIESTQNLTYSLPKYRHTYIIDKEPVDVYSIAFQRYLPAPENYTLYFRTDRAGKLIPGLNRNSWVTSSCDKEL